MNGCWSVDFTSDALWCGRRFRTFNVVDNFDREALAIEVDLNLPAERVIRALYRIAAWRGYPEKLRMDNGPEFIASQRRTGQKSAMFIWNLLSRVVLGRTGLLSDSTAATERAFSTGIFSIR